SAELAGRLLSQPGEVQKPHLLLSPPGRPHPVPGLFFACATQASFRFLPMRVLAGDIGGTKTSVAIVEIGARGVALRRPERYPRGEFGSLEEILAEFLPDKRDRPPLAGFGIAGPVRGGQAQVTKLPWILREDRLRRKFGFSRVRLVNDFYAAALGLPYVARRRIATLWRGQGEPGGPQALLGAGTGLGQAGPPARAGGCEPIASRGGRA